MENIIQLFSFFVGTRLKGCLRGQSDLGPLGSKRLVSSSLDIKPGNVCMMELFLVQKRLSYLLGFRTRVLLKLWKISASTVFDSHVFDGMLIVVRTFGCQKLGVFTFLLASRSVFPVGIGYAIP
ncbi:Zinc finger, CCHC-type [Gossypium australe]|uniref:Zinc finger, CCHC-type n=1 Tax=Gossypium australe TaxID=47621 RepID=A0A5B6ULY6_9ROSI|nr:Zinc finger, CCHC-type [Gossypium australe]